jgi:hypothetical protein
LPQQSAGASFQAIIMSGKFHGTMAPTTPTGCGLARGGEAWEGRWMVEGWGDGVRGGADAESE